MTDLWALTPNWREPWSITAAYRTRILTSEGGREQRSALRQTARRTVEFTATCDDERFRTLNRMFASRQGEPLVFPEATVRTATTAVSNVGSAAFSVGAVADWMTEDALAVLVRGPRLELRTIASTGSGSVTFTETNSAAWPTGTQICRGLLGRLTDEVSFKGPVRGVREGRVSLMIEPGSEPPPAPPAPDVTWNGREVFLETPNWRDGVPVKFSRPQEIVDMGRGVKATFLPVGFGAMTRELDFLTRTAAQAQRLIDFFDRQKGCFGEFYAPTDEPDIALANSVGSGGVTLTVAGTEFAQAYAEDAVHRAISIRRPNGTRSYHVVEEIETDGGESLIHLETSVSGGAPQASIVSWLPVCRLASDEMNIEWLTDQVARTRLSFRTLEALAAESLS